MNGEIITKNIRWYMNKCKSTCNYPLYKGVYFDDHGIGNTRLNISERDEGTFKRFVENGCCDFDLKKKKSLLSGVQIQ
jgi:hypothetical protein